MAQVRNDGDDKPFVEEVPLCELGRRVRLPSVEAGVESSPRYSDAENTNASRSGCYFPNPNQSLRPRLVVDTHPPN